MYCVPGTVPACLKLSGVIEREGFAAMSVSHGTARGSTEVPLQAGDSHSFDNTASRHREWSGCLVVSDH